MSSRIVLNKEAVTTLVNEMKNDYLGNLAAYGATRGEESTYEEAFSKMTPNEQLMTNICARVIHALSDKSILTEEDFKATVKTAITEGMKAANSSFKAGNSIDNKAHILESVYESDFKPIFLASAGKQASISPPGSSFSEN